MTSLLDVALTMHTAGLAVVPIASDGTKRPAVAWKSYQDVAPDTAQLRRWFDDSERAARYDGLGVLTGPVSGQLEMLEVEGRAAHLVGDLAMLLVDSGLGRVWEAISTGWVEESPSGGRHWFYRVDGEAQPNLKLARQPGSESGLDVLIETRGRGGFVVTAPSAGHSHPSGQPWRLLAGSPSTIPTLSVEDRDALHLACSTFDVAPTPTPAAERIDLGEIGGVRAPAGATAGAGGQGGAFESGLRPGDDYNTRLGAEGLLQLLLDHGWTRCHHIGGNVGVRRPGKDVGGISGSVMRRDDGTGGFWCWSSSTIFETEQAYDAFGAYALLEHGGDLSAAAKKLRADGYGTEPSHLPPPSIDTPTPTAPDLQPGVSEGPPATPLPEGGLRTSEDTLARLLVAQRGEVIRYCSERGRWLAWCGSRWEWQPDGAAVAEYAKQIARGLPDGSTTEVAHKRRCLSANGISGALRLASTDARVRVRMRDLDADPYLLNTPAGVVDLRTGAITPASPSHLVTRTTAVAPSAGPAPLWEQFLARTFAGDPDLATYTQRVLGQALIGKVVYPHLQVAHGQTATGKTTTANACLALLGNQANDGYAHVVDPSLLLRQRHASHPTEIAQLAGVRLVITSEVDKVTAFDEAKLKRFTGGDELSGRFMGKDFFSFAPSHFFLMLVNDRPDVSAEDDAIWRRIRMLPFVHQVPEAERDQGLVDKMVDAEGPQILAWLIAGAADFIRSGITEPAAVKAATNAYRADVDTVGRFVSDCCELAPAGTQTYSVAYSEVRGAYEKWCSEMGEIPVSPKALTTTLKARFHVESARTNRSRMLDGIRLIATQEEPAEEAWWS